MKNHSIQIILNVIAQQSILKAVSSQQFNAKMCHSQFQTSFKLCQVWLSEFLQVISQLILRENIFFGISVRLSCSKLVMSWVYLICSRDIHSSVNQMLLSVFRRSSHLKIKKNLRTAQRILMLISQQYFQKVGKGDIICTSGNSTACGVSSMQVQGTVKITWAQMFCK